MEKWGAQEQNENLAERRPRLGVAPGKAPRLNLALVMAPESARVAIKTKKARGELVVTTDESGEPLSAELAGAIDRRAAELGAEISAALVVDLSGPALALATGPVVFDFALASGAAHAPFGSMIGRDPAAASLTAVSANSGWTSAGDETTPPHRVEIELVMAGADVPDLYERLAKARANETGEKLAAARAKQVAALDARLSGAGDEVIAASQTDFNAASAQAQKLEVDLAQLERATKDLPNGERIREAIKIAREQASSGARLQAAQLASDEAVRNEAVSVVQSIDSPLSDGEQPDAGPVAIIVGAILENELLTPEEIAEVIALVTRAAPSREKALAVAAGLNSANPRFGDLRTIEILETLLAYDDRELARAFVDAEGIERPEQIVAKERGEGRGDSSDAVAELGHLLGPKPAAQDVAETEALVRFGVVTYPIDGKAAATALRALPADAVRGYDLALAKVGGPAWPKVIAELERGDEAALSALAIVANFRRAGRPYEPEAIAALATLVRKNGGRPATAVPAIEKQLSGAEFVSVNRESPIEGLPIEVQLAYAEAFKLLGGDKRTAPDRQREPRGLPKLPPTEKDPDTNSSVGGSNEFKVPYKALSGVGTDELNPAIGMSLLLTYGIPPELADFLAFYTPPKAAGAGISMYLDPKDDPNAGVAQQKYGYNGYGIFHDKGAGAYMTGEEIRAEYEAIAIESGASIENVSAPFWRNDSYYQNTVEPLLKDEAKWKSMVGSFQQTRALDQYIEKRLADIELAKQFPLGGSTLEGGDGLGLISSPGTSPLLPDRGLPDDVKEAYLRRNRQNSHTEDLLSGETTDAKEASKAQAAIDDLERLISDAENQQIEAAESEKLAREQLVEFKKYPHDGPRYNQIQTDIREALRRQSELRFYIGQNEEAIEGLRGIIATPGLRFPDEKIDGMKAYYAKKYRNPEGRYLFTSTDRAVAFAVAGWGLGFAGKVTSAGAFLADYMPIAGGGTVMLTPLRAPISARLREYSATLNASSAAYTADAIETLGEFQVMLIQAGLGIATGIAITVVTGGIGAAVAGTPGAVIALGTVHGLMEADRGAVAMLQGAIIGGLIPFARGYGTGFKHFFTAIATAAAHETASQLDIPGAYEVYSRGGDAKEVTAAATRTLDPKTIAASVLLEGIMAGKGKSEGATAPKSRVADVDGTLYRFDESGITKIKRSQLTTADGKPVRISEAELSVARSQAEAGNAASAEQILDRAEARDVGGDAISESKSKIDAEIKQLEKQGKTEDGAKLGELREQSDKFGAILEVRQASLEGKDIAADLVARSGIVPFGYTQKVADGPFVQSKKHIADAADASAKGLAITEPLIATYKNAVDRMRDLAAQLKKQAGRGGEAVKALRDKLADASREASSLRDRILNLLAPKPEVKKLIGPERVKADYELRGGDKIGGGGQADVYRLPGEPDFVVKVPAQNATSLEIAQAGVIDTRYGGLGAENASVVSVNIDGELKKGVRMPFVDGRSISQIPEGNLGGVFQRDIDAFEGYIKAIEDSDSILADMNFGNVIVKKEGGIAFVDTPRWTFDSWKKVVRRFEGENLTDAYLLRRWERAKKAFGEQADFVRRELTARLDKVGPPPPLPRRTPPPPAMKPERSIDAKVADIRTGEVGKVRSESELSSEDVALSMNHQLRRVEPDRVQAIIDTFPPEVRDKARKVLAQASGFGNMESLNSLRRALEPLMHRKLFMPGQGSLADNLEYVSRKGSFSELDGLSKQPVIGTGTLEAKCVVIVDDVIMARIKEDAAFAQKLVDLDVFLLEPRGYNSGINMFNAGNETDVAGKVEALLKRAEVYAKGAAPGEPFENSIIKAIDELSARSLGAADPKLAQRVVRVDANKLVESSNEAIAKQLNGEAGIENSDIDQALAGRSSQDQAIARELLAQRTEILSARRFANDVEAKHRDVMAQASARGIPADKVFFYIPQPGKSYGMLAMVHRQATGTPVSQYIDGPDVLAARAPGMGSQSMLVMFDDVAGTGESLTTAIGSIGGYQGRVVVAPLLSTQAAKDSIDDLIKRHPNGGNIDYQPVRIEKALEDSDFFKGLDPVQQAQLLKVVDGLGYGDNGLSTVFPYMGPDNNNRLFASEFARFFVLNKNQSAIKGSK